MKKTTSKSKRAATAKQMNLKPRWTYSPYRAALKKNGVTWAIVTPDGQNALSAHKAYELVSALNATTQPQRSPASDCSASVVKQFVQCPSCGKIWLYDGHAADVCCGGCSHDFYVPPDAMTRRLHECESVLRSVVKNVPIMVAGFRGTLLHSKCVALVGEQYVSDQATASTQPTIHP